MYCGPRPGGCGEGCVHPSPPNASCNPAYPRRPSDSTFHFSELVQVQTESGRMSIRALKFAWLIGLAGCPIGTPYDHYRPIGHQDTTVAVSPDDAQLAFNAAGVGGRDLYLLDLQSRMVSRIAETSAYETSPSFSPSGKWLVYAAGVPGDRADHIFKIELGTKAQLQLTDVDANDTSPSFSPDGEFIVFARDKSYNWGGLAANWEPGGVICLVRADGSNLQQLTADDEFAFDPHFSADGAWIIYSTPAGRMSIPIDGSTGPQPVAGPAQATPSHDGKLIAYCAGKYSPDLQIFIANSDATAERLLTSNMRGCSKPVFTHAGDALFYFQEHWANGPSGVPSFSLWKASIDGAAVDRIAGPELFDAPLRWKPE